MYYICLFHSVDLQEVEQAKALRQCHMENPHNLLHEAVEDTKGRHKMMKWRLMSSDVSWHIRDKLWPMPKHGSINLYVHGNRTAR